MNGRAYDYNLGRFLSVDPFIQFPTNSQSLNPYSYVLNNPLSGTDPTGYLRGEPGDGAFKAGIFIARLFKDSELAASEAAAYAAVDDDEQALAIAAGQAAKGNTATAQQIAAVVLGAASAGGKGKKRKGGGQNSQGNDNGKDQSQTNQSSMAPNAGSDRSTAAGDRPNNKISSAECSGLILSLFDQCLIEKQ